MTSSPDNYTVGKGIVTINSSDVGNSPLFEFRQTTTVLKRLKSVSGVRYPMEFSTVERSGELRIQLDEWTDEVIALATEGSTGDTGATVVVTQTNEIGPTHTWTFFGVHLRPADTIQMISEGWAILEITGDVTYATAATGGHRWGSIT